MAQFGRKTTYLVLDSTDPKSRRFYVSESLGSILQTWNSTTRFSPAHSLAGCEVLNETFDGTWYLTFLGPCHPFDFIRNADTTQASVWFTLGLYNVVHATKQRVAHDKLCEWIRTEGMPSEVWEVQDGVISNVAFLVRVPTAIDEDVRSMVVNFPFEKAASALKPCLLEYLPLVSAAIHKSSVAEPRFLRDVQQFHRVVAMTLGDSMNELDAMEKLNLLTVVNAGLSHFCSQTFSGTSPIAESVCHFWSHSLLGVGMASLALWQTKWFIEDRMSQGAIPDRLKAFGDPQFPPINIDMPERDDVWKKDYLHTVTKDKLPKDDVVRGVAYFSGRDGFRSSRCTLSAPLASIDACNSQKWNLLTLTHELAHVLTDGCLGVLCPLPQDNIALEKACRLLRDATTCSTRLDSVQRLFLKGVISVHTLFNMDGQQTGQSQFELTPSSLAEAIMKGARLINEVITHVLDFKYFYGGASSEYVSSIWSSWGVLPRGQGRVQEYLLRTLCALLSNHIGRTDELGVIRMELINELTNISKTETENGYIALALSQLNGDASWEVLRHRVVAMTPIVLLASTFLFSEALAAPFSHERAVHSQSAKDGYILTKCVFDRERISNRIRFLLEYATDSSPNSAASMWILYQLAFATEEGYGHQ